MRVRIYVGKHPYSKTMRASGAMLFFFGLFFLTHTFKWFFIAFYVHKTPIGSSLYEALGLRVAHLRALSYSTSARAISFGWVGGHGNRGLEFVAIVSFPPIQQSHEKAAQGQVLKGS